MKVVDDAIKIIAYQHGLLQKFKTGTMNTLKRKRCGVVNTKVSQ